MKTSVIQLENYDELASIQDKLTWHAGQRLILVWPKKDRIINNPLELELLKRKATDSGSSLALVTHLEVIKEWAADVKIPVFPSIPAAEKAEWAFESWRQELSPKSIKGRVALIDQKASLPAERVNRKPGKAQSLLAMLLSLFAFIVLLLVLLPKAEITYFPKMQVQQVEVKIKVSPIYSGFSASGNVPASLSKIDVSGELSMPSSGKTAIPDAKAGGRVTFTNLTGSKVTIPEGTLLFTSDPQQTQFVTLETVIVPDEVDGTVEAPVQALQAGEVGNLAAGSIVSLSGSAGALVRVTNASDFSGGTDLETPSPDANDYAALKELLIDELKNQAIAQLQAGLPAGTQLIPSSLAVEGIKEEKQLNAVGEPWDEARLQMTIELSVLTYQEADLNSIARTILDANLPKGYYPFENSLVQRQISEIELDEVNQATWTMKAYRNLIPEWDQEKASQALSGMKKAEAVQYFSELFLQEEPARFKMIFERWPWMPYLPTQITFVNGVTS